MASGTASGKQLSGRKQRAMIALERNIDPADVRAMNSKKHFKGNKRRGKHRSGNEE
jgi:large subunit GTPase 1